MKQVTFTINKNNKMKKIIFLFALSILCNLSYAQLGLRLGANLARFNTNKDIEQNSKFGISMGAYLRVPIAGKLYIQPEFNLTQHGSKENESDGDYSSYTINYLQIPILLKYVLFGDPGNTNFFVQGGPYFSKGVGKIRIKDCINGDCDTEKINFENVNFNLKSADVGLMLGAGVNVSNDLFVDVRVGLGISNISEIDDYNIRNTAINIGAGYTF